MVQCSNILLGVFFSNCACVPKSLVLCQNVSAIQPSSDKTECYHTPPENRTYIAGYIEIQRFKHERLKSAIQLWKFIESSYCISRQFPDKFSFVQNFPITSWSCVTNNAKRLVT